MFTANPEVLRNIIIELENVLFKLKDYAREVQASRKGNVFFFL